MWSVFSPSPASTRVLGAALGRVCVPGAVVGLCGPMGAGKTCFAQGVGEGLRVAEPIVSPTFVLQAEYASGRLPLLHADAWRLREEELAGLGLEEALERWPGVALCEWADRFPALLPADHLLVRFAVEGEGRRLDAEATGARANALLRMWREEFDGR